MYNERINKTRSWFYKRIDNIDKPLAKIFKRKVRKQSITIRNEKEHLTTDHRYLKETMRGGKRENTRIL